MDSSSRMIKEKVIISGDVIEIWKYENPIYSDIINRSSGFPEDIVTDDVVEGVKCSSSLRRARFKIRQYIWSNLTPYTKLITLTYAETCLDVDKVLYDIKQFFKKLKRKMNYDPKYIWVLEHQVERGLKEGNAGSLHPHIVLFNVEKISLDILNSCWPHGRTDIHILDGCRLSDQEMIKNAAAYLSKYISKENLLEFNKNAYHLSRNLIKPVETGVYYQRYIDKNGCVKYIFDDFDSLNLPEYNISYKKAYTINYPVGSSVVSNGCLYIQGKIKK